MATRCAWIRAFTRQCTELAADVRTALAASDVDVVEEADAPGLAPGVLALTRTVDEAGPIIEELSAGGRRRVLAVTGGPNLLGPGEVRRHA